MIDNNYVDIINSLVGALWAWAPENCGYSNVDDFMENFGKQYLNPQQQELLKDIMNAWYERR